MSPYKMWILRYLGILVLGQFFTAHSKSTIQVTKAINNFSWELLQAISEEQGNVNLFLSPLSLSITLAMTHSGAVGNTAKQIAHWLISGDDKLIASGYRDLISVLQPAADRNVTVSLANRMYLMEGVEVKQNFQKEMENIFGTKAESADFSMREKAAQQINSWVSEKTHGKIQEIVTLEVLDINTFLILVNALHFQGSWLYPFEAKYNSKDVFKGSDGSVLGDVTYMRQMSPMHYSFVDELNSEILILPYVDPAFKMIFVLPSDNQDLIATVNKLRKFSLMDFLSQAQKEEAYSGYVVIPRFKMESSLKMKLPLKKLGMTDMFNEIRANFSKVTEDYNLFVSRALHKAVIHVNETGSEAAAATAIVETNKVFGFSFEANRPFLFAIVEDITQVILFVGMVQFPHEY